ncbi:hypothetical protein L3X38_037361 [Prunus dulcis]|uniref:Uncharacterized protein n=1 Tax=Prunus dulcis TaxID=3755 RepID=A0AAD4V385_PRUDU|nr:hypothetical protein L3X38_037361 [Prunus dulcis]
MLRFSGEALSLWTLTRCPRVWQRVGTVAEGYYCPSAISWLSRVSRGVGYPALRQAPYVALVVPAYGERCLAWRRLSGVETDPIRGMGCTGVWGDIMIAWYGRTWRRLSGVLTGPIRGVGSTGVWGDYVKDREMK